MTNPNVFIDTPEAYQAFIGISVKRVTSPEQLGEALKSPLSASTFDQEKDLFGMGANTTPDQFLTVHNKFIDDTEQDLQLRLPGVKQEVIDNLSTYFSKGDEQKAQALKAEFEQRSKATDLVLVEDSLMRSGRSAAFNEASRNIKVSSSLIVDTLLNAKTADDYITRLERLDLSHEVMHSLLTSGKVDTMYGLAPVRNGLNITVREALDDPRNNDVVGTHGTWVNEAFLESTRSKIMDTEEFSYEPAVMVLELLESLDPTLEDELITGAIETTGPAVGFGKIENLLGPTGIEEVTDLINAVSKLSDIPDFNHAIVAMLPPEKRQQAEQFLVSFTDKIRQMIDKRNG